METITLNINTATVIPVNHTLHAKRGDYLFVTENNEIKVVDGKTFQALKAISNEQNLILKEQYAQKKAQELFPCKNELRDLVYQTLLSYPSGSTTGEIMGRLLSTKPGAHNKAAYNKVYHALDWLERHRKIEKIRVKNNNGEMERLWAVEKPH